MKRLQVAQVGEVLLVKRRGAKSLRLTITADDVVRVTLPTWVPYQAGIAFLQSRTEWIEKHRRPQREFKQHELIGKAHRLYFDAKDTAAVRTRVTTTEIRISHSSTLASNSASVQQVVSKAAMRALKQEGEHLLPQRLQILAAKYGFAYRSVTLKKLTARWGSCSHRQEITLNIFLMQLPWHLIDYVLIHELVHTKILHHGSDFWAEFQHHIPDAKARRKELRAFHPSF